MSNWRDNPRNYVKEYEKAVFPKLVFEECNKWWIPEGTKEGSITDAMDACLNNWYTKHTHAFDLFMDVNYFKNKMKPVTDYFDVDSYTEMETEIPYDMYSRTNMHNRLQLFPEDQGSFMKDVKNSCGGLRNQAM